MASLPIGMPELGIPETGDIDVNMTFPEGELIPDRPAPAVNQDALPRNNNDIMDHLPDTMLTSSEHLADHPAPPVPMAQPPLHVPTAQPPPHVPIGSEREPQIMFPTRESFPDRQAPAVPSNTAQGSSYDTGSTIRGEQVPSPDFERRMVDALHRVSAQMTELRQDFSRNLDTNIRVTGGYQPRSQTKMPRRQVLTMGKPYLHPGPQVKNALQTMKQRLIRRHVKSLLSAEDELLPPPPSDQAVLDFENGVQRSAPTLQTFRIAYLEPPKSKWNYHCFDLFLESFLKSDSAKLFGNAEEPLLDSATTSEAGPRAAAAALRKREDIYSYWLMHLYGLRLKYRNQIKELDNPLRKSQRLSSSARDARRQALFDRRLTICRSVDTFKPHTPILQQLGPAGMSSDESSRDNQGLKSYTIRTREWRAAGVKVFLRQLDDIHRQTRYMGDNVRSGPGNEVHIRRDPPNHTHNSTRKPVPYLPKMLYDPQWLASRNPIDLALLRPSDQACDLAYRAS